MELRPSELAQHALARGQPGAQQRRALLFVLLLGYAHEGGVVLLRLLFALFLFELAEGLHFFWGFGDDGGEVDFFAFGLFL